MTDPPYGLEFMGKEWDRLGDIGQASHGGFTTAAENFKGMALPKSYNASANVKCENCRKWKFDHVGRKCECGPDAVWPNVKAQQARAMQDWHLAWAAECLRVLKPGGHLLAFGGTRTWHRLACAVEDAGFEVRDSRAWLYGSGFSKSWNFNTMYKGEWCSCTTENALPYNHAGNADLPRVRDDIHSPTVARSEGEDALLLTEVQWSGAGSGTGRRTATRAERRGPRSPKRLCANG